MARVVQRAFSAREFRGLLNELDVSTAELARRSGVSVSSIGKWQREGLKSQTTPQVDLLRTAVAALAAVAQTSGEREYGGASVTDLTDRFMARVIPIPEDELELSDWRALRGRTQPDLAQRIGVSTTTLSTLERGASTLTDDVAERLAEELRITPGAVRAAWLRTKQRP
ncbi:helix-turn-helix transcriptional regulator [Tsukamurella spumae]|uniref:Helix-turn-helix domain-containing protein n=1 Tax=Tsukamurella spumae TaxID=44753 RepID=A0A846X1Y4_9ACTN|nr:helix-turn-helix domain-containing protein [Tsukamurella spumae]NKY19508.1 helix-turn-helix domain-containing protein [Tsukamurella spumae]